MLALVALATAAGPPLTPPWPSPQPRFASSWFGANMKAYEFEDPKELAELRKYTQVLASWPELGRTSKFSNATAVAWYDAERMKALLGANVSVFTYQSMWVAAAFYPEVLALMDQPDKSVAPVPSAIYSDFFLKAKDGSYSGYNYSGYCSQAKVTDVQIPTCTGYYWNWCNSSALDYYVNTVLKAMVAQPDGKTGRLFDGVFFDNSDNFIAQARRSLNGKCDATNATMRVHVAAAKLLQRYGKWPIFSFSPKPTEVEALWSAGVGFTKYYEYFTPTTSSMTKLLNDTEAGLPTVVHAPTYVKRHPPIHLQDVIAAYLIGAGAATHSYFQYSVANWVVDSSWKWDPLYKENFGLATGPPTVTAYGANGTGQVWRRSFASGAVATLNCTGNKKIPWCTGNVTLPAVGGARVRLKTDEPPSAWKPDGGHFCHAAAARLFDTQGTAAECAKLCAKHSCGCFDVGRSSKAKDACRGTKGAALQRSNSRTAYTNSTTPSPPPPPPSPPAPSPAVAGAPLWLDWSRCVRSSYELSVPTMSCANTTASGSVSRACQELSDALAGMLGVRPGMAKSGGVLQLSVAAGGHAAAPWPPQPAAEGYTIDVAAGVIKIVGGSGSGALYGAFRFLHLARLEEPALLSPAPPVTIRSAPSAPLRVWDLWDNENGSVERGYAGKSVFDWPSFPALRPRYRDYARLLASTGVNGIVWDNVNACGAGNDQILSRKTLASMAPIVQLFFEYGVRSFISPCYASPILVGRLKNADPNDAKVAAWWADTATYINSTWTAESFGGFLVKADCEGQPGPLDYNVTELEGANLMAVALDDIGAICIWRAFAHPHGKDHDQALYQFDLFKDWNGKTRDNVVLQCKNGPFDFQVREPVHSLFGHLDKVNLMLEVEVTQEYLGQARHVAHLPSQWSTYLAFDTQTRGIVNTTLGEVITGKFQLNTTSRKFGGFAGVSNLGIDNTWTNHPFSAANTYGFGRLGWKPALSVEQLTNEWAQATFGMEDPKVAQTVSAIALRSWEAYENYSSSLGWGFSCSGTHYAMDLPHRQDYINATSVGVGYNRGLPGAFGSTYSPNIAKQLLDVDTCPEELLLTFHHVPYGHKLKGQKYGGLSVLDWIYSSHVVGAATASAFAAEWAALSAPNTSATGATSEQIEKILTNGAADAKKFSDAVIKFFRGCAAGKCPVDTRKLKHDDVEKLGPQDPFGSVLNIGRAAGAGFAIALNSFDVATNTNKPLALPPLQGVESSLGIEASTLIPYIHPEKPGDPEGFRYVVNFDSQANHSAGQTAVYKVQQQHGSACGVEPNYVVSAPKLLNGSSCLEVFEDPRPGIGPVDHVLCVLVGGDAPSGKQHMQLRSIDLNDGTEQVLTKPFAMGLDPYLGMAVADLARGTVHVFAATGPSVPKFELSVWTVNLRQCADCGPAPLYPVTFFVITDQFPMLHSVHYSPHSKRIYTSYTNQESGAFVNRVGFATFESSLKVTPLGDALDKKYTQLNAIATTALLREYNLPAELFLSTMFDGAAKPPVLYLVGVNNVTGKVAVSAPVTNPFIDIEAPAICQIKGPI